ncbi:uncharacterized protein LOC113010026 isoform X3 [Astatotilapia calliptera]|uniref:uncharacterized protein LOC113010026 isoform X3 n=1 Tax=Astatotilapia calliptera TaxID=8154 RepID=UPI000E41AA73|nr:uncharacterized protein LOC113010026 isoform X3 [Astatotilapia calliptera]
MLLVPVMIQTYATGLPCAACMVSYKPMANQSKHQSDRFSQHALGVVVEVDEGERSVLLPCQYFGFIPENPTVMWTRSDLHPKSVHVRQDETDDLRGQNQRYSGRTSMRPDALDTGDFSLTLTKPTKTDSSIYTCSISDGREERRLRDIQLQVKVDGLKNAMEEYKSTIKELSGCSKATVAVGGLIATLIVIVLGFMYI